jgi:hypothetical protein
MNGKARSATGKGKSRNRCLSACPRLPGPFLPVPTQFDKRQLLDLLSPTMGRVKIVATNAHQANTAENELLILNIA